MVLWSVVFFVALTGTSASRQLAFPEDVSASESAFSTTRIVSGWEAVDGQLPYQISIRMVSPVGGVSSCGGTIVHEEWGLTAAHCTATRVSFMIRAGGVNLTTPLIMFETTEYYNHPDYVDELQHIVQTNDIALIRFGRKLDFSSRVQPVRLQSSKDMNKDYSGVVLVASGWGRTWTNEASPENLNWVFLRGTSNFLCRLVFGGSPIIVDSTICAGYYNVSSQSTCQGDSGGPLTVVDVDGVVSQVGVTSFVSATGCHTDIPAGFIRPGFYHDWYRNVTGIDFNWDPTPETETTPTEGETTEAASTEAPTSEAASTEGATTEVTTTEEATTDDADTTETATTEEGATEAATTEEAATEAATTEEATTEAATTTDDAATTEGATTEAATTEEGITEAATTDAPVPTEAATTEAATTTEEVINTTEADEISEAKEIEILGKNFLSRYFYNFW